MIFCFTREDQYPSPAIQPDYTAFRIQDDVPLSLSVRNQRSL